MGGKHEGPIEAYPKFWNLNPVIGDKGEVLRIPAWKGSFELVKKELEMILEREVLPTTVPEFPMVRRMTLGMNSPLVVHFGKAAKRVYERLGSLVQWMDTQP